MVEADWVIPRQQHGDWHCFKFSCMSDKETYLSFHILCKTSFRWIMQEQVLQTSAVGDWRSFHSACHIMFQTARQTE